MDISFASNKLKRCMEDERALQKTFGDRSGPLRRRLRMLAQAAVLADVPAGPPDHCHQLKGDRKGQLAVTLTGNWRLIFEPDHNPVPMLPDGGLDLDAVTAIKILEVVDYHGG